MRAIKITNNQASSATTHLDTHQKVRGRSPLWQNKSEFLYLLYNMMQCVPVLALFVRVSSFVVSAGPNC